MSPANLEQMREAWARPYQVNSFYGNPVHNRFHLDPRASAVDSFHQYGCAADLQTFPFPRNSPENILQALEFWDDLAELAVQQPWNFYVEPLEDSGVGHVHVNPIGGC